MTWKVNLYLEYAGKAPKEQENYYGYVLEYQGKQLNTRTEINKCTATRHRRDLIMFLEALKRCKPCELTVYTDSSYLIGNFNRIEQYVRNDWKKANNEPVKNADLWMEVVKEAEEKKISFEYGTHSYTGWLKSEIRRERNDRNRTADL